MVRQLFYVGVATCALSLVACADALRLEPPSGAGGDTGTGGLGGGGNAPVPCHSNSDCPEPTSVCDLVKEICVECLELDDCAHMPGTVCDVGVCSCPGDETWCEPDVCVDITTSSVHCGGCDRPCFGACADGACVDAWVPVGMVDAPSPRARHVAEWTGTHMFVWGGTNSTGSGGNFADGGLYDPATYTWTKTSLVGAPSARQRHTSVWTGDRVIVWGGLDGATLFSDGAMFDPATNTWVAMSNVNAPSPRVFHTAVWSGTEMIVFGGQDDMGEQLATGGRYDPSTDTWSSTAGVPAPTESRMRHTAVWDGTRMQIYGGFGDVGATVNTYLPDGAAPGGRLYDPIANGWTDITLAGQPSARDRHTAVFDGTRTLIFGGADAVGELATGHKLEAAVWAAFSGGPAPSARQEHTAVWLSGPAEMIVWGGVDATGPLGSGARFAASSNTWSAPTPSALSRRRAHTAVSTGDAMIVWGGLDAADVAIGDGGVFTP